jgi:hypothetical protein
MFVHWHFSPCYFIESFPMLSHGQFSPCSFIDSFPHFHSSTVFPMLSRRQFSPCSVIDSFPHVKSSTVFPMLSHRQFSPCSFIDSFPRVSHRQFTPCSAVDSFPHSLLEFERELWRWQTSSGIGGPGVAIIWFFFSWLDYPRRPHCCGCESPLRQDCSGVVGGYVMSVRN